jgi:hypothetical protein
MGLQTFKFSVDFDINEELNQKGKQKKPGSF